MLMLRERVKFSLRSEVKRYQTLSNQGHLKFVGCVILNRSISGSMIEDIVYYGQNEMLNQVQHDT
jgi:hypothetical protein